MDKTARDVLINRIGFPIISGVMLICLAILVLATRETPTGEEFFKIGKEKIAIDCMSFRVVEGDQVECSDEPTIKKRGAFFKLFSKQYLSLLLLFFAVLFWFTGFGAIEANFSNLGIDYFGLGTDQTSTIGLVYPISMIVASIPTGLIGRKIGRKLTLYICLGMLIVCTAIVSFWIILIKSVIGLAILMGIIGFFWMGIIVNTFPIVWRLCPTDELSTFTGIYYTFNQAAAIIGPTAIGIIFDIVEPYWGNSMYKTLYPFVLACVVIALVFLIFVRGGEAEEEQKAESNIAND
jgi:MFS family permease